jgi:Ca-activated chloride channel family protein
MNNKNIFTIIGIGILVFILVFVGISSTNNLGKSEKEVSGEKAAKQLTSILNRIDVSEIEAEKANLADDKYASLDAVDELPDISKYPLSVEGRGDINLEIFTSTEKGGTGNDGWLNDIAEKFNKANITYNGKSVSVSVRSLASGLATDYIVSGKYVPDAFTPSNELLIRLVENQNVKTTLISSRLVGNVAGILLSNDVYNDILDEYGSVSVNTVVKATAEGNIAMGYTNPLASSTGLNFLMSTLDSYDANNLLSDESIANFRSFQENVPFVFYTTTQMKNAAEASTLDGMISEYQAYKNAPALAKYKFVPFGVRHDNPLYAVGDVSTEKLEALKLFSDFCASEESQKLATKYGFNQMNEYKNEGTDSFDGQVISSAQSLWKEEKDSVPVTAVFVADVSGSMSGEAITNLKSSLINASQYINKDNYIGLVSYSNDVYINLPIEEFNLNHRAKFIGAVDNLYANGGTATFDAIAVATDMLLKAKEANPDTKLMMFLLSDGETNRGCDLGDIKTVLSYYNIPVYTIGYNADISALKTISDINEASSINADSEDIVYQLKMLFNSQM